MTDNQVAVNEAPLTTEKLVGNMLRQLRTRRGLSLRALADRSGLNINTLSLIENGKSSPSVSTLQQLASALEVPITAFFEVEPQEQRVVFTPTDQRPPVKFGDTQMLSLGMNLAGRAVQPFIVQLEPGSGSGERMIVHTGHEFVYCLSGTVRYQIEGVEYSLQPGDSLVFESHLPHCWENPGSEPAEIILVLHPSDARDDPGGRHYILQNQKRGSIMKIAVITEDSQTISQHFGRAPYYLVFSIEDGKIMNRELRNKLGHNQFNSGHHEEGHTGEHHGTEPGSHDKHVRMAEAISDCSILLCGGMGRGAYESMRALNIEPVVTDLRDIEQAVQAYIAGQMVNRTELLH